MLAIADAEANIDNLTTKIEEPIAASARLTTEIKNLEFEVAKTQAALDQTTSNSEKQLAKFNAEGKSLLESILALKAALTVLSKHLGSAFLQVPQCHVATAATTLQQQMQRHAALLRGISSHSQDYLDAKPTFKLSHPPHSGEIFGTLA